jgi:hypothetical protein
MWSQIVLKDNDLTAVGCLALESSMLERLITALIRALVGPVVSDALLKNKMMSPKLELLKTLLLDAIKRVIAGNGDKEKKARLITEVTDLCDKIASDIKHRNTVIHGEWAFREGITLNSLMLVLEAKNRFEAIARRGNANPVSVKEVMSLAEKFSRYQNQLSDRYQEYVSLSLVWPSRPLSDR